MNQACKQCSAEFEVADDDLEFYARVSPVVAGRTFDLPLPTLCSECREQRRMAQRNERTLFSRECDSCKKKIISMFHPDAPHPVYCGTCWWSDAWDGVEFGVDMDFKQPFFDQFAALQERVPAIFMLNPMCENSDYCNYCDRNRNCYLLTASSQSEDCYYGTYVWKSKNCVDCQNIIDCERCYQLTECEKCFGSTHCRKLENCSDCHFSFDLTGCKNCFGCAGLRNKSYHWFNEPLDKKTYEERMREHPWMASSIGTWKKKADTIRLRLPHKYAAILDSTDSTGNNLSHCKNATHCFDAFGLEDCKYIVNGPGNVRDCYDFTGITASELCLEGIGIPKGYHVLYVHLCSDGCRDLLYSYACVGCSDCFGCVGLRHKKFCILNKQYSQADYEKLVPKIIEKMKSTGEWGEFFPASLSSFGYNETIAQESYPLTKKQALAAGFRWNDAEAPLPEAEKLIKAESLPDAIDAVPDDVLQWAIECEATKRPFKLIKQELDFYRSMRLPVPHLHPDERHRRRMALKNPRKLWNRTCANCTKPIKTSFAPDRPEIVYCEECYLKAVY